MEASSFEEGDTELDLTEGSLNETANSIHFQYGEMDKEMVDMNSLLIRFIKEELEAGIRFDSFENHHIPKSQPHRLIPPTPKLYCLPYTILMEDHSLDLQYIFEGLEKECEKQYSLRFNRQQKEIGVKVHTESEMVFYSIRSLKTDSRNHKRPEMLDSKYLVNCLIDYYSHFYHKLYFRETLILFLYWAHQKDLLEHVISEESIKLVVLCAFINFGYGVLNIVRVESEKPEKIKEAKRMRSFAKMNPGGDVQILPELSTQFSSYTVQEKRGFYNATRKKFMQIKEIIPINFPLFPLSEREEKSCSEEISRSIKTVVDNQKENLSICKNLAKLFKFLHNKFTKPMKFVVDFGERVAYRHEFSQRFELEVLHPVLGSSLSRLKQGSINLFRQEINAVYGNFSQNCDPVEVIKGMLDKARP